MTSSWRTLSLHEGHWAMCCFMKRRPTIMLASQLTLTHWERDKMAAIFQMTFSNTFPWMKMYEFRLNFHWSLLLRVRLTIFPATSHYLSQWCLDYRCRYASLGLNESTKKQMFSVWKLPKSKGITPLTLNSCSERKSSNSSIKFGLLMPKVRITS